MDLMTKLFNSTYKFADVQGGSAKVARRLIARGSRDLLFAGIAGTGKSLLVKLALMRTLCLAPQGDEPCGGCANCVKITGHFRNGGCLACPPSLNDVFGGDRTGWLYFDLARLHLEDLDKVFYPWITYQTVHSPSCDDCFPCGFSPGVLVFTELQYADAQLQRFLLEFFERRPSYRILACLTMEAANKVPDALLHRLTRVNVTCPTLAELAPWVERIAGGEGLAFSGPMAVNELVRQGERNPRRILNLLTQLCALGEPVTESLVREVAGHER